MVIREIINLDYEIQQLSERLFLIRWHTTPTVGSPVEQRFLDDLHALLTNARQPLYFLIDVRQGRISNAEALRDMGKLTAHAKWGGSASFSGNPTTRLMMDVFRKYAHRSLSERLNQTWHTPQQALNHLESLSNGVTTGIDVADLTQPHT